MLTWNAWNCCGAALKNNVNDVGFIKAMIERLGKEYSIDPKRIYATGLSNGAMMAYRLGAELSDKIAAIAPVAGALNAENLHPSNPVSVLIFHGTEDKYILYGGGTPEKLLETVKRVDKPVSYAVSYWVSRDRCKTGPEREVSGQITREIYSGGLNGTEVALYTVKGQGHAWPGGGSGLLYGNMDEPTKEISATDIIWDFFKAHPKKGANLTIDDIKWHPGIK